MSEMTKVMENCKVFGRQFALCEKACGDINASLAFGGQNLSRWIEHIPNYPLREFNKLHTWFIRNANLLERTTSPKVRMQYEERMRELRISEILPERRLTELEHAAFLVGYSEERAR